jgi:hypothetical protein
MTIKKTPKKWLRLAIALTSAQGTLDMFIDGLPITETTRAWIESVSHLALAAATIYALYQTETVSIPKENVEEI